VNTVWSFFSGAMGLDLGFEAEGLAPSLAVEVEPVFCETVRANRPEVTLVEADVAQLDGESLRRLTGVDDVDLFVGGPPCQSFCPGGKRAALNDPRGNLIVEYLRLVAEVRPRRFVLENVGNLFTAAVRHRPISQRPGKSWNLSRYSRDGQQAFPLVDGPTPLADDEQSGSALRLLLETAIADLGYGVSFGVLDSSQFGAPQKRLTARARPCATRAKAAPSLFGSARGSKASPTTGSSAGPRTGSTCRWATQSRSPLEPRSVGRRWPPRASTLRRCVPRARARVVSQVSDGFTDGHVGLEPWTVGRQREIGGPTVAASG